MLSRTWSNARRSVPLLDLSVGRATGGQTVVRTWKLFAALWELLLLGWATGEMMEVLVGHLVFHFMLQRCVLSALEEVYSFIASHRSTRGTLPPALVVELQTIMALLFLVRHRMDSLFSIW